MFTDRVLNNVETGVIYYSRKSITKGTIGLFISLKYVLWE